MSSSSTSTSSSLSHARKIVLFDGECNVCDRFVNFLIDRDRDSTLVFASLQSVAGRRLVQHYHLADDAANVDQLNPDILQTMVMIDTQSQQAYTKSSAAIRTLASLPFPYTLLYVLLLVPALIRNFCYTQFAQRRYRWFGTTSDSTACRRMTPELRSRFLGDEYFPDTLTKDS
jgi:predicted DCC family thiol-disulfide oxidoreductase YuxK